MSAIIDPGKEIKGLRSHNISRRSWMKFGPAQQNKLRNHIETKIQDPEISGVSSRAHKLAAELTAYKKLLEGEFG